MSKNLKRKLTSSECENDCFVEENDLLNCVCPLAIGKLPTKPNETPNENILPKRPCPLTKVPLMKPESLVEKSLGPLLTFGKQRLAMEMSKNIQEKYTALRIFSYETEAGAGQRKYVVTTVARFWHWYMNHAVKHQYELIPEGVPCRLYFDLEYSKPSNPNLNPIISLNHFLDCVKIVMKDLYDIDVNNKDFLALDSSTDDKFSCHLIAHLPGGMLFPDSTAIRPFAQKLREKLLDSPPQVIWNSDKTKETVLFDQAVYTKNRNFRLFLSKKFGKTASLTLAEYCIFYGTRKPSDHLVFLDSLCVPVDVEKISKDRIINVTKDYLVNSISVNITGGHKNAAGIHEGCGPSPYPYLEEFLLIMLRKWKVDAYFRQWKIKKDAEGEPVVIIYYPANCRYCFNIGREHKSNGTFWSINLKRMEMWQKCFDPDCRGFQSNVFPIPGPIRDSTLKQMSNDSAASAPLSDDVASLLDQSSNELSVYFDQWEGVWET